MIGRLLAFLLAAAAPAGAAAQCNVALVFGLDVSSSVDENEYALQLHGLSEALRSREVAELILSGPGAGIMASAFSWSGIWQQELLVDWTWLGDYPAIVAFTERLRASPRDAEQWPTAIGRASEFAANLHRRVPRVCWRRIVDISGDGVNNHGVGPDWYRRRGDFTGLVINGLVIRGADPDPLRYYIEKLIHGPGAFVEVAESYADYPRAIKRKLMRELTPGVAMAR